MNRLLHWLNGDLHDLLFSFITVFRLLADFFPNPNHWTERTGVFQLHGFSIKMQIAFERQCFPQHGTGDEVTPRFQGCRILLHEGVPRRIGGFRDSRGPFTRVERRRHPQYLRECDSCGEHGCGPGEMEGDAGDVGEGD